MSSQPLSDGDVDRLKDALAHEEVALSLYRQYSEESQDPRLKEMFAQFSKNESWHAAAIREKLKRAGP